MGVRVRGANGEMRGGPRPPRLSALHAVAAGIDFERYFRWRRAREGDPFYVRFPGFDPVLFTGTPDGAREIFRAPVDALKPPRPNPIEPMVGSASLILTAGERHRRDRALLAPAFHGTRIRALAERIRDSVETEIDGGTTGSEKAWTPGRLIDSRAAARAITLRVILEAVLGVDSEGRRADYIAATAEFLDGFSGPLLLPALRLGLFGHAPWDRFLAARDRLDELLRADIARRRADSATPRPDILSALLNCTYDDGSPISDADLCEQLRTLLVAGHETTATTLVWALFHLHREPELLGPLRAEVLAAGRGASATELAGLPYLDAVCQETLRLHPPVPVVLRGLTESFTLRGVPLAPGDIMGVAVPLLHSDPEIWDEPEQFRPERFLDRGEKGKYSMFEFAPFGGGHRRCVGATLAEYELRIALATIVSRVELRLTTRYADGAAPLPVPHNIAAGPRRPIPFEVVG